MALLLIKINFKKSIESINGYGHQIMHKKHGNVRNLRQAITKIFLGMHKTYT
jgi:hypothetical protein